MYCVIYFNEINIFLIKSVNPPQLNISVFFHMHSELLMGLIVVK